MLNKYLAIIGGSVIGLSVGFIVSGKLFFKRKHTGGSFIELYNDNRGWL